MVVEHSHSGLLGMPTDGVDRPRVGSEFGVEVDPPSGGNLKDREMRLGDPVTRLEVLMGSKNRFDLIFGQNLEQVDQMFLRFIDFPSEKEPAVW